MTEGSSRIVYTLMWDHSMLEDESAREADRERRRATFTRALENMKVLVKVGRREQPPEGALRSE